jgi:hypothetical protein
MPIMSWSVVRTSDTDSFELSLINSGKYNIIMRSMHFKLNVI